MAVTNDQTKALIAQIIASEQPENVEQLVDIMQTRYFLSKEQVAAALIELEADETVSFVKGKAQRFFSIKDYLLSRCALWFWFSIVLSTVAALVFFLPANILAVAYTRYVLGLIFLAFLPGYVFIKAMFPADTKIPIKITSENKIERVALSLASSLCLAPLVALVLNYSPWGIRLESLTVCMLFLTLAFAFVAGYREYLAAKVS
ncbi:MAG: DUF1616 domain-containing protein [Candidatus Bathyarchaeota archaeon]|nr:DUF1616 domain-containing protein [Candidatus Bathyarchaeota archaeon]